MKVIVCSVFDTKAGVFAQPFFSVNLATALRSFRVLVTDGRSMPAQSPEDFQLYQLGQFDDDGGLLEALPQPLFLANATQVQGAPDA